MSARGFLVGSLALIALETLVQPGSTAKVGGALDLSHQAFRRALSPTVAGIPRRATPATPSTGSGGSVGEAKATTPKAKAAPKPKAAPGPYDNVSALPRNPTIGRYVGLGPYDNI